MITSFDQEPNMATIASNSDQLIGRLMPEKYRRQDNVETFISACARYFKVAKVQENIQEILVIGLLSHELIPIYESVPADIKGYEARLREAFLKKSTLMEDLEEAVHFERSGESIEEYFAKVNKLAEKLVKHQWTKEEIERCLLIHGSKDSDVKKEIKLRDIKEIPEIKNVMRKVDEIRRSEKPVHAVRPTYREAVKRGNTAGNSVRKTETSERRPPLRNNNSCWNCKEIGHRSSECKREKKITCYACGETGHVRRECKTIICNRCNDPGHKADVCYTNLNRRHHRKNEYQERNQYHGRTQRDNRQPPRSQERDGRNWKSEEYQRGFQRGRQIAMMEEEECRESEKNEQCQDDEEPILALQ